SFATQQTFATGANPNSVVVADLNGDGKPDLTIADWGGHAASVLVNTTPAGAATFAFATQQTFPTGTKPEWAAVADINGDGKPDLTIADWGGHAASVLVNTTPAGAATFAFATQQTFATGTKPEWAAVADINGDGKPDLIVVNSIDNTVSVLLNTTVLDSTTSVP